MKKLILLFVLCLLSSGLSGCVYNKITLVKIKGDEVSVPFGSITPFQGKNISGLMVRQVFLSNQKNAVPPPISDINIKDNGPESSVDVKK